MKPFDSGYSRAQSTARRVPNVERTATRTNKARSLRDRRLVAPSVGRPPCLATVAPLWCSPPWRGRIEARRWAIRGGAALAVQHRVGR